MKKQTSIEGLTKVNYIIKQINDLWYKKQLCDKRGWKDEIPLKPTTKHFRTIIIYTNKKVVYKYDLSLWEYKQYRLLKFKILGFRK